MSCISKTLIPAGISFFVCSRMAAEFAVSKDIEGKKSRNLPVSKTSVEVETFNNVATYVPCRLNCDGASFQICSQSLCDTDTSQLRQPHDFQSLQHLEPNLVCPWCPAL